MVLAAQARGYGAAHVPGTAVSVGNTGRGIVFHPETRRVAAVGHAATHQVAVSGVPEAVMVTGGSLCVEALAPEVSDRSGARRLPR